MIAVSRRLPGIRVDVAPPPAVEALPRMDVAVMVGFASTGPLHQPVVVESVAQFAAVFGTDAALAWDDARGERVYAYLGPAVRAFFSNGGRRCWVIRVARVSNTNSAAAPFAETNLFAMPGVLQLDADGINRAATVQARCEGAWSDGLRIGAALQRRSMAIDSLAAIGSPSPNRFAFRTRIGPKVGDLVEFDDQGRTNAYAVVDAVSVVTDASGPYAVKITALAAFECLVASTSPPVSPSTLSPPLQWAGTALVAGFGPAVAATLFPSVDGIEPSRLHFDAPVPASLEAGHWVRWSDGGQPVWFRIDNIDREPAFTGSPPAMDSSNMMATVTGPAWRELDDAMPLPVADVTRAHLLSLDLRVDQALGASFRLTPVALAPSHPQGWWAQWTDADFYRPADDVGAGAAPAPVPDEVARFPLARIDSDTPLAWIPLGVEPLFGSSLAPYPNTLTGLERDGLSQFDASLFLDPELAGASMFEIESLADDIRFFRPTTRPLRGLHAAWSIGAGGLFSESSLLAIPDAIHLGWHKRDVGSIPPPHPPETTTPPPWHSHRGPCATSSDEPLVEPDFGVFLDCGTQVIEAPVLDGPDAPVPPGAYRLSWTSTAPHERYVLLEATQPDFSDAREVYSGDANEYIALNPRDGVYYYQVFAWIGDDGSAGSNAITVLVRSDDWVQVPADGDDPHFESQWLSVHRAALRMAGAGGELFVALAMPRHFRTQQALRYAARLREVRQPPASAEPDAFGFNEGAALSYGALYFPWLQSDVHAGVDADDVTAGVVSMAPNPKVIPPDGVALGILAARASRRGAWIAAANEPMKDVVALSPPIAASDWQAIQDAQVNLLRTDPRGFFTLSADTLSLNTELRPINVRRLLILLRRLALRRGISYVFEPNGPALRRAVQRGFDALMGDLFRRGAFAGATAAQSFRVVTDDTINTPADADAGRFLVELRVAPSIPMHFIAVQLAQSGERLTVTEEL